MVNWKYCLRCGNVVDEFESICSVCRLEPMWGETHKGPLKTKRDKWEVWFDEHNHKMEFLRTLFSAIAATTGIFVFLKVFGLI